jgi:hypothetical protein
MPGTAASSSVRHQHDTPWGAVLEESWHQPSSVEQMLAGVAVRKRGGVGRGGECCGAGGEGCDGGGCVEPGAGPLTNAAATRPPATARRSVRRATGLSVTPP